MYSHVLPSCTMICLKKDNKDEFYYIDYLFRKSAATTATTTRLIQKVFSFQFQFSREFPKVPKSALSHLFVKWRHDVIVVIWLGGSRSCIYHSPFGGYFTKVDFYKKQQKTKKSNVFVHIVIVRVFFPMNLKNFKQSFTIIFVKKYAYFWGEFCFKVGRVKYPGNAVYIDYSSQIFKSNNLYNYMLNFRRSSLELLPWEQPLQATPTEV